MSKLLLRKILPITLALLMIFSTAEVSAYTIKHKDQAETLKSLGLFMGTDTGFHLEKVCSRAEGAVMLVRLLGKEQAATSNAENAHPFTDVPLWADRYVAYLYANKLTKGMNADTFGSTGNMTYKQYITFILRSLGYSDTAGDFSYDTCNAKASDIQLMNAQEMADISKSESIYRDNVVFFSYKALFAKLKDSNNTLLDKLYKTDSAISGDKLQAAAQTDMNIKEYLKVNKPLPSTEIYNMVRPAVVSIGLINQSGRKYAEGSGFIIDKKGLVATTYNAIKGAYSAKVSINDENDVFAVTNIVGYDEKRNIAILQIDAAYLDTVSLGDSDTLKNGDHVYAFGNALGLDGTITDGVISNPRRTVGDQTYIQATAPVSAGSSGGVLVNEYGEAIGITYGTMEGQNINFFIPINELKSLPQDKNIKLVKPDIPKRSPKPLQDYLYTNKTNFTTSDKKHSINLIPDVRSSTKNNDGLSVILVDFCVKDDNYSDNRLKDFMIYGNREELNRFIKETADIAGKIMKAPVIIVSVVVSKPFFEEKVPWPQNNIQDPWFQHNGDFWDYTLLLQKLSLLTVNVQVNYGLTARK